MHGARREWMCLWDVAASHLNGCASHFNPVHHPLTHAPTMLATIIHTHTLHCVLCGGFGSPCICHAGLLFTRCMFLCVCMPLRGAFKLSCFNHQPSQPTNQPTNQPPHDHTARRGFAATQTTRDDWCRTVYDAATACQTTVNHGAHP